jgi:type VI secretion system secreted protein VgrG
MQGISARGQILRGTTNSRKATAGYRFSLTGSPLSADPVEYLVVASNCSIEMAEVASDKAGGMIDSYRCALMAMPADRPFRLEAEVPWPVMRGPQTAKVVGEAGQEITTDSYGRIKVQFPWDRYATGDETSSCWIRVAQVWAGANWGAMFIPRIGQEVVVEFLDGDPDRPLVTGCVYNANQMPPYALPDNKTRSVIKTNSSTGGGSNELRFEDKAGSEEVYFHAQKDYNKVVLNNETVKITQDTTTTVEKGNRSVTVSEGNNSATVSQGNNSLTVSQGNDSTTVSLGNHTLSVDAGSSTISAGQQITLKANEQITLQVGGTSITLSAEGISISGPQISASAEASMSLSGGGSMSLTAGAISIN